jgi:Zn-dependent peptidase ImmA (M78 family)/DNA-binding XRE family transcriptional regulator
MSVDGCSVGDVTETTAGAAASLVRRARGLRQDAVARTAGIAQGTLSKFENGLVALDRTHLSALAVALDIPLSRLTDSAPTEAAVSACAFHRKRSTLPVSEANRVRALLDLSRAQVEDVLGEDVPALALNRTTLDLDDDYGPIDAAREARAVLHPEPGPFGDLAAAAEALGVLLVRRDLATDKIDAIGTWPDGHRPMFLLNSTAPADRQRFTLAHELGHAIMHQVPTENQETEADQFASELLMPARQIRDELTDLNLAKLAKLKAKWRVSMAALIRRARDLDAISDSEYRKLNIDLSAAGYRKNEPVPITPDHPRLFTASVRKQLEHDSADALAHRHGLSRADLDALTGGAA